MTESQMTLLRQVSAENAVIFSFMDALIATHHNPRLLMEAFELQHQKFMAGCENDPNMPDARLDEIRGQYAHYLAALHRRTNGMLGRAADDTAA